MKFKEREKSESNITVLYLGGTKKPMPEPEVGKIYHGFDDGKIRLSRLIDWKILERIDLDNDEVDQELLDDLQKEILHFYWVFSPEQTIIFKAQAVDDEGNFDAEIGDCYFIRTQSGGWFGALANLFFWCELDVDNRWYNKLIKEQD